MASSSSTALSYSTSTTTSSYKTKILPLPPHDYHHHDDNNNNNVKDSDSSSDETSSYYTPTTLEAWMHRPPAFVFAETSSCMMLVWDTEEGGGIVTKQGIGKLPAKHAESVITMLMKEIERLRSDKKTSCHSGKRMLVDSSSCDY